MAKRAMSQWFKMFLIIAFAHFAATLISALVLLNERFRDLDSDVPLPTTRTERIADTAVKILGFPVLTVYEGGGQPLAAFLNSLLWAGCITALVQKRRTASQRDAGTDR